MRKISALAMITIALACGRSEERTAAPTTTANATTAAPATGVEVGQRMPAYTAKSLEGQPFDLAQEKGNVVLLNLWATWCGPCRFEIPELERLHQEHTGRNFKVIGVSVDEGEAAVVKQFAEEQKITYPLVHDPEGKLATLLETSVLPTSVLLDREGKVVWKKIGVVMGNDPELQAALKASLPAKS